MTTQASERRSVAVAIDRFTKVFRTTREGESYCICYLPVEVPKVIFRRSKGLTSEA